MRNERGFTLIEILVSLAIFAVVVIGALGVLGAAGSGGFLSGFTTGFVTTRAARDLTAASVFLQAFQEHAASQAVTQGDSSLLPGTYCQGPDPGCSNNLSSAQLGAYPLPPTQPYELGWQRLDVTVERWYWNDTTKTYACAQPNPPCTFVIPSPPPEYLVRLHSTLTWQYRGVTRTLDVNRFLP
ncbi:MAG: hypothetical protein AUI83_16530 [Armatimonadetes bacterium 13_1_40CM_3_65_7]|nr:MAG: hypothetical protein AUI83_16530 [Armatimonadetes bacterium 13_1_40CM_3_65_7]